MLLRFRDSEYMFIAMQYKRKKQGGTRSMSASYN